ncbi:MAG: hypothetical protein K6T78_15490 [Alicyclobacillus sp.]|nr:hypothetical protein [Alicyclobacillus sp.]
MPVHPSYIQMTMDVWFGPITLTVYSPDDALWISDQIKQLTDDLSLVQSGIIHAGSDYIVLEREIDQDHTRFSAQCFRSEEGYYAPPELEILIPHLAV